MTEASDRLPDPRTPGRYRIALVCLGNICRSPMAHVVLESALGEAGLDQAVEVMSAGTADYHVGGPMDRRAAATLTTHGYDASRHRAQQLPLSWLEDCDLVLAMDRDNLADILDSAVDVPTGRVRMFRDFDPRPGGVDGDDRDTRDDRDVPDPYYGENDGFEQVLAIVTRTSRALVDRLRGLLLG
jgi:protein-tyrosine phosphatase